MTCQEEKSLVWLAHPEKVRVCAAVAAGDRRHSAPARRIAQAQ